MTLIELLIVVAIVAMIVGSAVTDFRQLRERRRLEAAAAQLETDLMATRSLAVARNHSVRVGFESTSQFSCYVIHVGAPDDCHCGAEGTTTCRPGAEVIRTVMFPAPQSVALHSNVRSILFDGTKGTTTPTGTLRLIGRDGAAIHQIVNIMGRVRTCSPPLPGGGRLPGYPAC
jgi:type IV fimbrial biogenesis protein FimT